MMETLSKSPGSDAETLLSVYQQLAGADGICRRNVATLGLCAGFGEERVRGALARLVELGLVAVDRLPGRATNVKVLDDWPTLDSRRAMPLIAHLERIGATFEMVLLELDQLARSFNQAGDKTYGAWVAGIAGDVRRAVGEILPDQEGSGDAEAVLDG